MSEAWLLHLGSKHEGGCTIGVYGSQEEAVAAANSYAEWEDTRDRGIWEEDPVEQEYTGSFVGWSGPFVDYGELCWEKGHDVMFVFEMKVGHRFWEMPEL